MLTKRQIPRDLKAIKIELEAAINELEVLNFDPARVHIFKAINIVDASLKREAVVKRKHD